MEKGKGREMAEEEKSGREISAGIRVDKQRGGF